MLLVLNVKWQHLLIEFTIHTSPLCLLKVSSEGMNYKELPVPLVKDLNLMKLFNGNFRSELEYCCEEEELDALSMFSVTILYDGVTWNISSRSEAIMLVHCCHFCNVFQPDLYELGSH